MNKDKINELLFTKSEILRKRQNRIFLFLFVSPLIYFLLDNSYVSEVKTPLIFLEQTEIILIAFPFIYAILLLVAFIQTDKVNEIEIEIDNMENPILTKKVLRLLSPISIIKEIINEARAKGFFGYLGIIVIYIPIIIFCLLFPLIFLGYIIYDNFKYEGELERIALWSAILAIWTFIPAFIKLISSLKKTS
ncbi:MAG: hypothetical protein V7670_00520 [Maribacter arcticus]|uniref:hypothetical protein n=1 Tax=Maribacter arcticus TaxID=561365 RepID=UPI003002269B